MCEAVLVPTFLVVRLTNKVEMEFFKLLEMAEWILMRFSSMQFWEKPSFPQYWRRKGIYYTKYVLQ